MPPWKGDERMRDDTDSVCDTSRTARSQWRNSMSRSTFSSEWAGHVAYSVFLLILIFGLGAPAVAELGPCDALSKAIYEYRRGNYFNFWFEKRVTSECRTLAEKNGVPELTDQIFAMLPNVDTDAMNRSHRFAFDAICTLRPSWAISEVIRGVQGKDVQWRCIVALAGLQDGRAQQALKQYLIRETVPGEIDTELLKALSESIGTPENRHLRKWAARLLPIATLQSLAGRDHLYGLICLSQKIEDMPDVANICANEPKPVPYSSGSEGSVFLVSSVILLLLGALSVFFGFRLRNRADGRLLGGLGGAMAGVLPGWGAGLSIADDIDTFNGAMSVFILLPGAIVGCVVGAVLGCFIGSLLGGMEHPRE